MAKRVQRTRSASEIIDLAILENRSSEHLLYTIAVIAAYLAICWVAELPDLPVFMINVGAAKALLVRIITIAAMGGLGSHYWRIQRNRRREATGEVDDVAVGPVVSQMADLREQKVVS